MYENSDCLGYYYCKHMEKASSEAAIKVVIRPKGADGMANDADPDQSDLGLHFLLRTVFRKLRNITVSSNM